MKKVRFLVAMILVVAALTIGVMAASTDYVAFETETIEVPTGAVTINIVSKVGFESAYASFNVDFDSSKWTISGLSAQGGVNGNRISWIYDSGITATAEGTAFSFVATPIAGQNVENATFTLSECAIYNMAMDAAIMEEAGVFDTLTVKAAVQKTPFAISESINTNATIKGAEKTYTGVWVGTYTVTPNDDVVTGITINGKTINKVLGEGQGNIVFKVASIATSEATPTVTVNVQ